jgi:carbon storage regulator
MEVPMLVLSRKQGEKILIADDVTVTVLSVQGARVRLGIQAPDSYRILRGELAEWTAAPVRGACADEAACWQPLGASC